MSALVMASWCGRCKKESAANRLIAEELLGFRRWMQGECVDCACSCHAIMESHLAMKAAGLL